VAAVVTRLRPAEAESFTAASFTAGRSKFVQITHFGHSCVLVETATARLLFDPGSFSSGFEQLRDLTAVLLTHQHPDHVDIDRLPALLEANPAAQLIADAGTVAMLADKGLQARTTRAGETFELSGTAVHAVGGEHAVIHPDVPVIDNVGFVLENGAFYHPGDSFFVPEERIDVLGLPTGAPWLKLSEAVDFLRAVAPRTAVPIHEAVLSRPQMHYRMFEQLRPESTEIKVLTAGRPAEL